MLSGIKRLIGLVRVEEVKGSIIIDGIPGWEILNDIQRFWSTSRISMNMFTSATRSKVVFHQFFAVDVLYMFEQLYEDRKTRTSRRAIGKIIEELKEKTWLKGIMEPPTQSILDYSKLDEIGFPLLPHQKDFLNTYDRIRQQYQLKGMLLAAPPGSGKACRADTRVKIPGGWRRIDKLKIGDQVISVDGTATAVTGVYPQGKLQLYRVTFWDGRVADVCADHLWWSNRRNGGNRDEWKVRNTKELMSLLGKDNDDMLYVPLARSEIGPDQDLPLDPYLMGVLLGDGSMRTCTMLSTPDEFIRSEVQRLLPNGHSLEHRDSVDYQVVAERIANQPRTNQVTNAIRDMNLFGSYSFEKFIPPEYLDGSHEQRLALLQGLMDTDGTVGKAGGVTYSTSSPELAANVQKLVWSLGGICRIGTKLPHYTHNGERRQGRLNYVLSIRMKCPADCFRLPRKKELAKEENQYSKGLKLRIRSIEPIDVDEAVCISVEHPSKLFVIDDYVVTHNTVTDLALAVCLKVKVGIIIAPKNSIERVWEATIKYNMPKSPSYWISNMPGQAAPVGRRFYVFHYEALDRALDLAKRLKEKGDDVFIALDESHNFNEINSQRTQNFIELCKLTQSTNILWASGTPIKAMGYECIPLLRTICGDFPAHVEERFKKIYGRDAKRALDILQNRIGLLTFKVPKQQVVDGTPTVKEVNIKTPNAKDFTLERVREDMTKFIEQRLEFYRKGMKDYERLFDDCLKLHEKSIRNSQDERDFQLYKKYVEMIRKFYDPKEMKVEVMFCNSYELRKIIPSLPDQLKKEFKSVRSIIKYVNLKVMGEALGGILGKARSRCHLEMVDYVPFQEIIDNSVKKTVIFTSYVEVVQKTEKVLKELGYKPVLVYGDTNKNLAAIIRQFETDEDTNPLIATFPSLSTAVPLIMANTLIMLNSPFRDHERDQTISRCNRLGQDEQVYVFDCFLDTQGDPNISTRSKDILEWSREQVSAIMGIDTPTDLETSLESMMHSSVPLERSAAVFLEHIRQSYPVGMTQ